MLLLLSFLLLAAVATGDVSSDRSVLRSLCSVSFFSRPCDWNIDPCRWPGVTCDPRSGEVTMIIVTEPSRATTLPSLAGMRSLVQLTAPLSSLTGEVVLEMGPALAAVDLSSAWKMTRLTISASSSATRLASLVLGQCPAMVSLDGLCVASQSLSSLVVTGSQSLAAFDGQSVLGCVLPMLKYADFSYTPLTQFPLARGPHPALGSLRMRYLPLEKLQPYTPGALPNVLPDDLADITPNLYELDIAGSNLVALPSSLSKLKLTTLDVSQNSLLTLTPLPDPAILTTLDISGCVMLSLLNTSNLGFTSPNVVTTLRMSNLPGVLNDPTTVGPLNLTLFRHLATLDASRNPWILQSPLLAATAPLKRVDLNDCTIIGELTLPCASSLGILNFQGNMITRVQNATAVLSPSAVCWAGLTLVNAARNRLEDISFLADAVLWKSLAMVDLGDNAGVGLTLVAMYANSTATDKTLRSLRLAGTGVSADIADIFAAVVGRLLALTELDLSRNPGITGTITEEALRASGAILPMSRSPPSFPFMVLNLDSTSISLVAYAEAFPFLTELSIKSAPNLSPVFATAWPNLRKLDLRGNFLNMETGLSFSASWVGPDLFPGTQMVLDAVSGGMCPEEIRGGDLSMIAVRVDPRAYRYTLCRCPAGTYPAVMRCIACPEISDADRALGLSVTCKADTVTVMGGVLRRDSKDNGVLIPTLCPSLISSDNPCNTTTLSVLTETIPVVTCAQGHTGRLCSGCLPGFFRLAGRCTPCSAASSSSSFTAWLLPVLTVLVATAVGTKVQLGGASARSGLVRTLGSHAATLGLLPSMKLSAALSSLLLGSSAGSASLRFEGLECLGVGSWDPLWGPFALAASLPAVSLVGSLWITATAALVARLFGLPHLGLRAGLARGFAWLWLTLLATSVCSLLTPANCVKVDGRGAVDVVDGDGSVADTLMGSFVASDLTVACTAAHWRAAGAGVAIAALFSLATLAAIARLTLGSGKQAVSSVSAFLRSPFRADSRACTSWELVFTARRLAVAVFAALGPGRGVGSPAAISLVLLLSTTSQAALDPFKLPMDNKAELASLVLLLFTYVCALLSASPLFKGSHGAKALMGGLAAANVAFLAVLLVAIAGKAVLRKRSRTTLRGEDAAEEEEVDLEQELLSDQR